MECADNDDTVSRRNLTRQVRWTDITDDMRVGAAAVQCDDGKKCGDNNLEECFHVRIGRKRITDAPLISRAAL